MEYEDMTFTHTHIYFSKQIICSLYKGSTKNSKKKIVFPTHFSM